MEASVIPFGPGGLSFLGLYFLILVAIGWYGSKARESHSLKDFYLGGKGIGWWVLLLTLFATQYSGNDVWIQWQGLPCGLFMDHFRALHDGHHCWLSDLRPDFILLEKPMVSSLLPITSPLPSSGNQPHRSMRHDSCLGNFLLAQLMAMGPALQADDSSRQSGLHHRVILLAIIMLIYETLGGFRAVAWTDVIQGVILIFGFGALVYLIWAHYGGLTAATNSS